MSIWKRMIAAIFPVQSGRPRSGRPGKAPRFRRRRWRKSPPPHGKAFPHPRAGGAPNAHQNGPRARIDEVVAYHGTKSPEIAKSIFRDGWQTGTGNALGDGTYFTTDLSTAKGYTGGAGGVYLKCAIRLGRVCTWDGASQARYAEWCRRHAVTPNGSAITAYLLRHGFDTVRSGNILVVLAPQYANPTAWKRWNPRIRILGVYRASDDQRIRV